eukprot:6189270-Pleurochrysis_carterae.AAC.2
MQSELFAAILKTERRQGVLYMTVNSLYQAGPANSTARETQRNPRDRAVPLMNARVSQYVGLIHGTKQVEWKSSGLWLLLSRPASRISLAANGTQLI